MDKKKQLSRAQEKARAFIEEYNVEKIISEMLNSLVHSRDEKPIIFMVSRSRFLILCFLQIKYLASLVTEQELDENGIVVTGPMPQRIPIITYPKFDSSCKSLLKKHLTREIWANMKKKSTSKGGNIQICAKSGVQRPEFPIGVMASDEEAYKTFGDLFQPIIKDIHPEFDFRFNYKFDQLKADLIEVRLAEMQEQLDHVTNFRFEAQRNFKGTPFSPLMTKEAKLQVEKRVVEALGSLYGSYYQVQRLSESDTEWLSSIGIDPQNKNEEFDAAGINDDWPVGRGIFIQEQRNFLVLVNFEDHVRIVVLKDPQPESEDSIVEGTKRLFKMVNLFDSFGFA